jgi:proteasome lid subunit RPN8/RPN11
VRIGSEVVEQLRLHAVDSYPREAVGLLGGRSGEIVAVIPLTNRAHGTGTTLVSARDLRTAEAELAARGLSRVGAFHSHANTPARPSQLDLRAMRPGQIELIVLVNMDGAGAIRAWSIDDDGYSVELTWAV